MQYRQLAVFALAGAAAASQLEERQDLNAIAPSLINVLITALPPSILAQAATAPDQVYSDIVASISAGNTPAWYAALPTDVQALLAGQATAFAGAAPTAVAPAQTSAGQPAAAPAAAAASSGGYVPSVGSMVTPSVGSMVTPSVGSMVTPSVGSMVTPSVGSMVTPSVGSMVTSPGGSAVPPKPSTPATTSSGPVLQSTNAAAMPSAVIGSGVAAGFLALVGMLAL